jgi:Transglutaminase-like superfamily
MLIRYGYEIAINCPQPTPMVCLLPVSEDRKADMRVAEKFFTTPIIPTTTYIDTFGNRCRRLVAPAGDFAIWGDASIEDDGKIDPANFAAREVPVADLPDDCLLFLMGSRYCETDKLSQTAWDLFGQVPPGWGRVQAVCDFVHEHIKFDYQQARSTRTAFEAYQERIGVCRDFAHLAVTALQMPQHSRALHQRPSRRHRRARGRPHGFQRLDRSVPRGVMVDIRPSQQHAADWQDRDRARPRRRGYSAHQFVRAARAQFLPRLDLRGLRGARAFA